jgi:hypothetical protein
LVAIDSSSWVIIRGASQKYFAAPASVTAASCVRP